MGANLLAMRVKLLVTPNRLPHGLRCSSRGLRCPARSSLRRWSARTGPTAPTRTSTTTQTRIVHDAVEVPYSAHCNNVV
jgi:hypothetical protein